MAKTFEDNIARLEEIVTALEKGDAKLADSLKLVHDCGAMLDKAEQKVAKLSKGADGAPVESPFISEE